MLIIAIFRNFDDFAVYYDNDFVHCWSFKTNCDEIHSAEKLRKFIRGSNNEVFILRENNKLEIYNGKELKICTERLEIKSFGDQAMFLNDILFDSGTLFYLFVLI